MITVKLPRRITAHELADVFRRTVNRLDWPLEEKTDSHYIAGSLEREKSGMKLKTRVKVGFLAHVSIMPRAGGYSNLPISMNWYDNQVRFDIEGPDISWMGVESTYDLARAPKTKAVFEKFFRAFSQELGCQIQSDNLIISDSNLPAEPPLQHQIVYKNQQPRRMSGLSSFECFALYAIP